MPIKLRIKRNEQQRVRKLGGCLLADGKTWVIPDGIRNINPFKAWLPKKEGHIVQRPYFVLRANWRCRNCGKETPVVTLGAKRFHSLVFETEDKSVWRKEEGPLVYTGIEYLEGSIRQSLQSNYPFLQKFYSKCEGYKRWGNSCIHCQAFQEDDADYVYDFANPFSPLSIDEAREIRVIYFKMEFDYYIRAGYELNELYLDILQE